MKRASRAMKCVAAALSVVMFFTNVLFLHAAETVWKDRQKAKDIQLAALPAAAGLQFGPATNRIPLINPVNPTFKQLSKDIPKGMETKYAPVLMALSNSYGTVRKISTPKTNVSNSPIVIHIQDVHLNPEAQGNIAKTVQELINQKKVGLVALEGVFAPIDFSVFRKFPHQEAVKTVADYLLEEKKISGAVHAAFTSPVQIPSFVGVDQLDHYNANVEAYKQAAPIIKAEKEKLEAWRKDLAQRKFSVLSAQLKAFDQKVEAYRAGSMEWGAYVKYLSERSEVISTDVEMFLAALEMESKLDFKRVEGQRTDLIAKLVAKMDKVQTQDLVNHSLAYRSDSIGHADFYDYLKSLCRKNDVELSNYPAMDSYIRYAILSDSINVERIFADVTAMEAAQYGQLARSFEEKALVAEGKKLYLTGKLLDFALTKDEWQEYKQVVLSNQFSVLSENLRTNSLRTENFEKFYEEAEIRDRKMAENLIASFPQVSGGNPVAVLVTGGFHSSGIDSLLNAAGYTTITFTPKISKIDENGSGYLGVFTQEKTPLDKLFAGEKLFVTPKVIPELNPAKALVAGVETIQVPTSKPADVIAALPGLPADTKIERDGAEVDVVTKDGTYEITPKPAGKIKSVFKPALGKKVMAVAASIMLAVTTFLGNANNAPAQEVIAPNQKIVQSVEQSATNKLTIDAESNAVIENKESATVYRPIKLKEQYQVATSNGRYKKLSDAEVEDLKSKPYVLVVVRPQTELTGFHIDLKDAEELWIEGGDSLNELFVLKDEKTGNWGMFRDGSPLQPETKIIFHLYEENGVLGLFIPTESIKDINNLRYIHVQTGEQQRGIKMNSSNVASQVDVYAVSDTAGKIPEIKSELFFSWPNLLIALGFLGFIVTLLWGGITIIAKKLRARGAMMLLAPTLVLAGATIASAGEVVKEAAPELLAMAGHSGFGIGGLVGALILGGTLFGMALQKKQIAWMSEEEVMFGYLCPNPSLGGDWDIDSNVYAAGSFQQDGHSYRTVAYSWGGTRWMLSLLEDERPFASFMVDQLQNRTMWKIEPRDGNPKGVKVLQKHLEGKERIQFATLNIQVSSQALEVIVDPMSGTSPGGKLAAKLILFFAMIPAFFAFANNAPAQERDAVENGKAAVTAEAEIPFVNRSILFHSLMDPDLTTRAKIRSAEQLLHKDHIKSLRGDKVGLEFLTGTIGSPLIEDKERAALANVLYEVVSLGENIPFAPGRPAFDGPSLDILAHDRNISQLRDACRWGDVAVRSKLLMILNAEYHNDAFRDFRAFMGELARTLLMENLDPKEAPSEDSKAKAFQLALLSQVFAGTRDVVIVDADNRPAVHMGSSMNESDVQRIVKTISTWNKDIQPIEKPVVKNGDANINKGTQEKPEILPQPQPGMPLWQAIAHAVLLPLLFIGFLLALIRFVHKRIKSGNKLMLLLVPTLVLAGTTIAGAAEAAQQAAPELLAMASASGLGIGILSALGLVAVVLAGDPTVHAVDVLVDFLSNGQPYTIDGDVYRTSVTKNRSPWNPGHSVHITKNNAPVDWAVIQMGNKNPFLFKAPSANPGPIQILQQILKTNPRFQILYETSGDSGNIYANVLLAPREPDSATTRIVPPLVLTGAGMIALFGAPSIGAAAEVGSQVTVDLLAMVGNSGSDIGWWSLGAIAVGAVVVLQERKRVAAVRFLFSRLSGQKNVSKRLLSLKEDSPWVNFIIRVGKKDVPVQVKRNKSDDEGMSWTLFFKGGISEVSRIMAIYNGRSWRLTASLQNDDVADVIAALKTNANDIYLRFDSPPTKHDSRVGNVSGRRVVEFDVVTGPRAGLSFWVDKITPKKGNKKPRAPRIIGVLSLGLTAMAALFGAPSIGAAAEAVKEVAPEIAKTVSDVTDWTLVYAGIGGVVFAASLVVLAAIHLRSVSRKNNPVVYLTPILMNIWSLVPADHQTREESVNWFFANAFGTVPPHGDRSVTSSFTDGEVSYQMEATARHAGIDNEIIYTIHLRGDGARWATLMLYSGSRILHLGPISGDRAAVQFVLDRLKNNRSKIEGDSSYISFIGFLVGGLAAMPALFGAPDIGAASEFGVSIVSEAVDMISQPFGSSFGLSIMAILPIVLIHLLMNSRSKGKERRNSLQKWMLFLALIPSMFAGNSADAHESPRPVAAVQSVDAQAALQPIAEVQAPEVREIDNNIKQRANGSLNVAHMIQPIFDTPSQKAEKAFEQEVTKAIETQDGKVFNTAGDAVKEGFNTDDHVAAVVFVNTEEDLATVETAAKTAKEHHDAVVVVVSNQAKESVAKKADARVDALDETVAIASVHEAPGATTAKFEDLFAEAAAVMPAQYSEGRDVLTNLSQSKTAGISVTVAGISSVVYSAGEALLLIMRMIVVTAGVALMIRLRNAVLAAKMA